MTNVEWTASRHSSFVIHHYKMPSFSYRALQADGKIAEGVLDAAGRPDALRQIETLGLRPMNVLEKSSAAAKNGSATAGSRRGRGKISFQFPPKKNIAYR